MYQMEIFICIQMCLYLITIIFPDEYTLWVVLLCTANLWNGKAMSNMQLFNVFRTHLFTEEGFSTSM